jgi:integrase/recombinase XerD
MPALGETDPDDATGQVLAGRGASPVRGARRVNAVLAAVRGMAAHAVAAGRAPAHLVPLIYEVADGRDLPDEARGEDAGVPVDWALFLPQPARN